jgi:hypothetical protein
MSKEMPSFVTMAKNLGKSIVKNAGSVLFGNELTVSHESFEMRLSFCRFCESYEWEEMRCFECGCYLNIKAKLYAENCPLYKWPPVMPETHQGG